MERTPERTDQQGMLFYRAGNMETRMCKVDEVAADTSAQLAEAARQLAARKAEAAAAAATHEAAVAALRRLEGEATDLKKRQVALGRQQVGKLGHGGGCVRGTEATQGAPCLLHSSNTRAHRMHCPSCMSPATSLPNHACPRPAGALHGRAVDDARGDAGGRQ